MEAWKFSPIQASSADDAQWHRSVSRPRYGRLLFANHRIMDRCGHFFHRASGWATRSQSVESDGDRPRSTRHRAIFCNATLGCACRRNRLPSMVTSSAAITPRIRRLRSLRAQNARARYNQIVAPRRVRSGHATHFEIFIATLLGAIAVANSPAVLVIIDSPQLCFFWNS